MKPSDGQKAPKRQKHNELHISLKDLANASAMAPAESDIKGVLFENVHHVKERLDQECWGCLHGFHEVDPILHVDRAKLWDLYCQCRNQVSLDQCCQQLAKFHKNVIKKKLDDRGIDSLSWPVEMIKTHLTVHQMKPKSTLMNSLKKIVLIEEEAADCVVIIENGQRSINYKAGDFLLAIQRQKMALLERISKVDDD